VAGCAMIHHSACLRKQGWDSGLEAAGIDPESQPYAVADYGFEGGYGAFREMMGSGDPPTAFFFYSDLMAAGALRSAADMGIPVPAGVSIIGFDDIDLARYAIPRLSTIRQPKAELGRLAAGRIRERIADRSLPCESRILPVSLVERESTGKAPA
jgi:DNA-binding LacI/PurR family transcriptional regulator